MEHNEITTNFDELIGSFEELNASFDKFVLYFEELQTDLEHYRQKLILDQQLADFNRGPQPKAARGLAYAPKKS
jgi:hypothetical protein